MRDSACTKPPLGATALRPDLAAHCRRSPPPCQQAHSRGGFGGRGIIAIDTFPYSLRCAAPAYAVPARKVVEEVCGTAQPRRDTSDAGRIVSQRGYQHSSSDAAGWTAQVARSPDQSGGAAAAAACGKVAPSVSPAAGMRWLESRQEPGWHGWLLKYDKTNIALEIRRCVECESST